MTLQEIGGKLAHAKKLAHVPLKDSLSYAFKLGANKITQIESGSKDYYVSDLVVYLNMCDTYMTVSYWDLSYIYGMDDLREAIKKERKTSGLSVNQLAKLSRVSYYIIRAFENGTGRLKMSSFLNIADALNLDIEIEI